MNVPSVWHDDEDVILCTLWWLDHDMVIEESCHLSGTGKEDIWLEVCFLFLHHFLTEQCPGVRVDGEDDEDLKRVETLKGRLVWIPGGKEA